MPNIVIHESYNITEKKDFVKRSVARKFGLVYLCSFCKINSFSIVDNLFSIVNIMQNS